LEIKVLYIKQCVFDLGTGGWRCHYRGWSISWIVPYDKIRR